MQLDVGEVRLTIYRVTPPTRKKRTLVAPGARFPGQISGHVAAELGKHTISGPARSLRYKAMPPTHGQPLDALESPQLLIDLDVLDANLERMRAHLRGRSVVLRVHFKSLKCAGLARYLAERGVHHFLCAKLNEG